MWASGLSGLSSSDLSRGKSLIEVAEIFVMPPGSCGRWGYWDLIKDFGCQKCFTVPAFILQGMQYFPCGEKCIVHFNCYLERFYSIDVVAIVERQSPRLNGMYFRFCRSILVFRNLFWFPMLWYAWASRSVHCSLGLIAAALAWFNRYCLSCSRKSKPKFRRGVGLWVIVNSFW